MKHAVLATLLYMLGVGQAVSGTLDDLLTKFRNELPDCTSFASDGVSGDLETCQILSKSVQPSSEQNPVLYLAYLGDFLSVRRRELTLTNSEDRTSTIYAIYNELISSLASANSNISVDKLMRDLQGGLGFKSLYKDERFLASSQYHLISLFSSTDETGKKILIVALVKQDANSPIREIELYAFTTPKWLESGNYSLSINSLSFSMNFSVPEARFKKEDINNSHAGVLLWILELFSKSQDSLAQALKTDPEFLPDYKFCNSVSDFADYNPIGAEMETRFPVGVRSVVGDGVRIRKSPVDGEVLGAVTNGDLVVSLWDGLSSSFKPLQDQGFTCVSTLDENGEVLKGWISSRFLEGN